MTTAQDSGSLAPQLRAPGVATTLAVGARKFLSRDGDRAGAKRDALTAFLIRISSAGLLYLSQVVLARWMGAHEYGIYVYVWTWVLVLGGLSQLGFPLVMIRLVPEYRERRERALLGGLLVGGPLMAAGLGTVTAAVAIGALVLFGDFVASPFMLPLFLAFFCVPMVALTDVQDGIGRGHGWIATALLPPYVLRPVALIGLMSAAHACGLPMQSVTAAGAAVVATWATAMLQLAFLRRRIATETATGPRAYDFRRWLATALPLAAIGACEMILQYADVLVLSLFLTPADIGMYFAAAKTMSLVLFVHYAVGSAVANRISALHARGDEASLRSLVRDAVSWTFWPSLAAVVVILVIGKPLLALFAPQFVTAYPVMLILAAGFLVRAAMGPSEFLLNMLGEQKLCAAVLATAAAINIGLNLMLVPRLGINGAAIATAAAFTAAAIMTLLVARHRLGLEIGVWNCLVRR